MVGYIVLGEQLKKSVIISNSNCPYFNLAYENYLLRKRSDLSELLFLYVNRPCVVMGKFQNPWKELNMDAVMGDGIPLIRRQSGGGTVFHDLGNLNFSFILNNSIFPKEKSNNFLIKCLEQFGVKAHVYGKNDLVVYKKSKRFKFSGSAYKQIKNRSLHHGTLLVESKIHNLKKYLIPSFKQIETKAIPSRPSSVINLCEVGKNINLETLKDSLASNFSNSNDNCLVQTINFSEGMSIFDVDKEYKKLKELDETLHNTPDFLLTLLDQKGEDVIISVKNGLIDNVFSKDGKKYFPVGVKFNTENLRKSNLKAKS